MVEKIGVSESHRGIPTVEDLVQQLGVPAQSMERCISALYTAFGKDRQSTQRIIDFLTFKITGNP